MELELAKRRVAHPLPHNFSLQDIFTAMMRGDVLVGDYKLVLPTTWIKLPKQESLRFVAFVDGAQDARYRPEIPKVHQFDVFKIMPKVTIVRGGMFAIQYRRHLPADQVAYACQELWFEIIEPGKRRVGLIAVHMEPAGANEFKMRDTVKDYGGFDNLWLKDLQLLKSLRDGVSIAKGYIVSPYSFSAFAYVNSDVTSKVNASVASINKYITLAMQMLLQDVGVVGELRAVEWASVGEGKELAYHLNVDKLFWSMVKVAAQGGVTLGDEFQAYVHLALLGLHELPEGTIIPNESVDSFVDCFLDGDEFPSQIVLNNAFLTNSRMIAAERITAVGVRQHNRVCIFPKVADEIAKRNQKLSKEMDSFKSQLDGLGVVAQMYIKRTEGLAAVFKSS